MSMLQQLRQAAAGFESRSNDGVPAGPAAVIHQDRAAQRDGETELSTAVSSVVAGDGGAAWLATLPAIAPPEVVELPDAMVGPCGFREVLVYHDWPASKGAVVIVDERRAAADRIDEPGNPGDGPTLVAQREVDERPLPLMPPAACPTCESPHWWQGLGDVAGENLHCCACITIPMRRMLIGLWEVWAEPLRWKSYEPVYWDPFAHLVAEEAAKVASEAKTMNGDF
jgi:hypothetical protein